MKTNLQAGWAFVAILFIISACNDDPQPAVSGVLKADIDTVKSGMQYYYPYTETEMGYEFMPTTDGIITHLGVKTLTAGQYQVRVFANGWGQFRNVVAQKTI